MQHGKTTVIFFLGGCTFTEVSAIRFLAQHDESKFFFSLFVYNGVAYAKCSMPYQVVIILLPPRRCSMEIHFWNPWSQTAVHTRRAMALEVILSIHKQQQHPVFR